MIDYCIKVPEREEYEKGHKYPYNSCEILCSINGFNLDKLSNNKNEEKNANNENHEHLKEEKNEEVRNGKKEEREPQRDINIHKEEEDDDEVEIKNINDIKIDMEDLEYEKDQKHLTENKKEKNINLVYSLFDYFFSFLQNESSLNNDVLVGYFSKITNYLIKTETKIVLDYILIYKNNIISSLLSNIHNYSIANIIKNILNALSEEESPEANDKYMLIVNKLIEQFSLKENDDNNTIEIICDLIINSIIYNNRFKLSKIIDEKIIDKIKIICQQYFENYSENKNKILNIINMLTKMNNSILSNYINKKTSTINYDDVKNEAMSLLNDQDKYNNPFTSSGKIKFASKELVNNAFINNYSNYINSLKDIAHLVINDLIKQSQSQQNSIEEIECSYNSKIKEKLGINKLIEFEFIISVLDIYVNCMEISKESATLINENNKILFDKKIFSLMIEYYFKYKNNNFFDNIMIDLIKIIFDNNISPEELIVNILQLNNETNTENHNNFITLLINDLIKETYFIFENSNNKMNSLLLGSDITILKYIFSCGNPCMNSILEKLTKEKFFYENFVVNIDKIFHKKLYKLEGETDKLFYDSLGLRVGLKKEINGNSDMPFSLESINDMITFYLSVNEKYVNGEEYMSLFKEREKRLEEIKKSSEYARLGNQKDEPETEEEEDEFDDIDIPKPMFFNSKLEEKNKEKEKVNNNNNSNENKNNENINENQKYNDINYWHIELKDDNMNNIMKELLL
jgi:hypothetical protein